MKEKGSRKVNFPEAIILLVIVVFIMIWTTLIGQIPTAVGLVYCAALCGIYGKILGHTWDEMFKNILHVVHGGPAGNLSAFTRGLYQCILDW